MPIRLLVGVPGSEKTSRILDAFRQFTPAEHLSSVRLVAPSVTEVVCLRREIITELGIPGILGDPIRTFLRLASDIAGVKDPPISESRGALRLRRILRESDGCFRGAAEYPTFPADLAREIALLKSLRISPDDLRAAVTEAGARLGERSIRKLLELAAIYQSYQQDLGEAGEHDAADLIELAIGACRDRQSANPMRVFVDGFSSLAPLQVELLLALSSAGADVVIALDDEHAAPALCDHPDVIVERLVGEGQGIAPAGFTLLIGATPDLEVQLVVEEIRRLMRDGASYSEMGIVAGSLGAHRDLLTRAFDEYGIPVAPHYRPLSESVLAQSVLSRLDSVTGSRTERERALKSILASIPLPDDVCRLPEHFAAWKAIIRGHDMLSREDVPEDDLAWLLRRAVESGSYLAPGHEDGVTILGAGSLHGRKFEIVFILGLVEGAFPRRPREDPLITGAERAALNALLPNPLPTYEDDLAEDRRRFHDALSRHRERLYLCRSKLGPSGRPARESRFIDEARRLLGGDPTLVTREAQDFIPPVERSEVIESLVARTILDCRSADDDRGHIAAASYNLLLEAGLLGPADFDLLSADDGAIGDRLPSDIRRTLSEVDADA